MLCLLKPMIIVYQVCLLTTTIQVVSISSANPAIINVWPKPTTFSWPQPQATLLSPIFTITSPIHDHLSPAVDRYLRLILTEHHRPLLTPLITNPITSPPLKTLAITITDLAAPLHHNVNESYTLLIPSGSAAAKLVAETAWGAMRGLETFSQLVWGQPSLVAVGLNVWDSPLFAHRGLLLDTSRNYYGVEDILRTIKGMSYNKLNVFHWHITDSQSFPLVVPSEPYLAAKGSYGADMQYSPSDVRAIVQFGLEHGVRVIPEIDAPGHTGSWAEAYPEIVSCANMFWWPSGIEWADRLASEPGTGQLNPLNPKTYQVVKNVIKDVATMFPEPFYHAGADEIVPGCWKTDPTIQSFLSNGGTLSQVLEIFVNSTFPYIVSLNRTAVYWEDVLLDADIKVNPSCLPPDLTILQTWNNGPNNTKKIVAAGYRAIVSSSEFYYLDCGHGSFLGNDSQYDQQAGGAGNSGDGGSWCGPFKTWQTIYDYDITYGLSEEEAKLVLGGEVALWSEQADPTVLDSRIWPRTSAMAETLWSGNRDENGEERYAEATDRLNEWRYRMWSRGIRAEPIQPLWCFRNPGMCNRVNQAAYH
ncbi:Glyco_hydro_20 domain-containing protein/Glyco_hydro_20b domain-containing protein [Cephalotus follicularis]|uniref:Beta-hexosaminidase n=1 Tax=Cephalotus follicularis TaxID=3775 RepID=A0A1Q3BMF1_CEPFO|nr:Glyco_hydro_20 domain-containing protein/Glyco_hydro_20b domain-containing protein [Cephalotus follicularis]